MLFDKEGNRNYMIEPEWRAFLAAAYQADPDTRTFCLVLLLTGARLTEIRNLTARSFDRGLGRVVIRCLKRRSVVYRDVPISSDLFDLVEVQFDIAGRRADPSLIDQKLWPWCRTTAWGRVKAVARDAGLPAFLCKPKTMRHTYAMEGTTFKSVPLALMQKLLGHARIESTTRYTTPLGQEARVFSSTMFSGALNEAAPASV
jgi:integrase